MPRAESPVVASDPVLADFAQALRGLRASAHLTLNEVALRANYSPSALSNACSGRRLPTWELTRSFVTARGGDETEWRARWHDAAEAHFKEPEATDGFGRSQPTTPVQFTWSEFVRGLLDSSDTARRAFRLLLAAFLFLALLLAFTAILVAALTAHLKVSGFQITSAARFIGGAAGTATITFAAAARLRRRRYRSPRHLECKLVENIPLVMPPGDLELRLINAGDVVLEPYLITVRLKNKAMRDIPSHAFDDGKPIFLDTAVPILGVMRTSSSDPGLKIPPVQVDGTMIAIGPGRIAGGASLTISVLATRPCRSVTPIGSPLLDTDIRSS